jgi:hypothetical protein
VLIAGVGNPPCQQASPAGPGALSAAPGGPLAAGMYAAPLKLAPGHWYEVGATQYGGPADPTWGSTGSIGGSQGFLPAHPDTFAELSVLDSTPPTAAPSPSRTPTR